MTKFPDSDPAQAAFLQEVVANSPAKPGRRPYKNDKVALEAFNATNAVALIGDSCRVIVEQHEHHKLLSYNEAKQYYAAQKVMVKQQGGESRLAPAFPRWFENPGRREFSDYGFYPGEAPADFYNTFAGWAVAPAPGDFSLMEEHIHENICRGRDADASYLLDWAADIFQNTLHKPGVAPVLKGDMGTGKSTFSDCLARIVGPAYSPAVDRPKQLTGQFNGHLEPAVLIRCEEGIYANDPEQRGVLKHLITSPTLMVERKGINARQVPNYSRLIVTTNYERGVPASFGGERRFFVLEVGNRRKQDVEFFTRLHQQMASGGYEAMLHALLHRAYDAQRLLDAPKTDALVRQILEGLQPDLSWWLTVLTEGRFPVRDADWDGGRASPAQFVAGQRLVVEKDEVLRSYRSYVRGHRNAEVNPVSIGMFLGRHATGLQQPRGGQANARKYDFPPIDVLRRQFCADLGGAVEFDDFVGEAQARASVARPFLRAVA